MNKLFKVALGATAVIGTGIIIKKLIERDSVQDKMKEREAMKYLREKYGDDALVGKKIMIINDDEPMTKAHIAKDVIEYELEKED